MLELIITFFSYNYSMLFLRKVNKFFRPLKDPREIWFYRAVEALCNIFLRRIHLWVGFLFYAFFKTNFNSFCILTS